MEALAAPLPPRDEFQVALEARYGALKPLPAGKEVSLMGLAEGQEDVFLSALRALPGEETVLLSARSGRESRFSRQGAYPPGYAGKLGDSDREMLKSTVAKGMASRGAEWRDSALCLGGWAASSSTGDGWLTQMAAYEARGLPVPGWMETQVAAYDGTEGFAARVKTLGVTYALTQDYLSSRGIESLCLFRGMSWSSPSEVPAALGDFALPGKRKPVTARLLHNPLSSFSASVGVGVDFAAPWVGGRGASVLLAVDVPAARVVSLPMTGMGCFPEAEAVVACGEDGFSVFPVVNHRGEAKLEMADGTYWAPWRWGWNVSDPQLTF